MNATETRTTAQVIAAMLQENTGVAMCDSGGENGRHWQQNQGRDFENEPATVLEFDFDEIGVTHNVYHWLLDRLEFADDLQSSFDKFAELVENEDCDWFELLEKWCEYKGIGLVDTINTYNGEDLLSQALQYYILESDDDCFIALMIHNGADVRGGYTAPKMFRNNGNYGGWCECPLFDNANAYIQCSGPAYDPNQMPLDGVPQPNHEPHNWSTDDGYHWYADGACGLNAGQQLETYEFSHDETDKGQGKIYVDDNGKGYCPICGGELSAS